MDDSWLLPYADMLTLLLAMFIVLYAMSSVNEDKFEELKETMNDLFAGGSGLLVSDSGFTELEDDPMTDNTTQNYMFEEKQLRECQQQMNEYFEEMNLSQMISTKLTQEGLLVTIQDIALFDSGKAYVRPESFDLLKYLGLILAEVDNHIQVRGHTDNLPISNQEFPSNWELSTERALNIMKNFLANQDIKANRFSVVGYSEYSPIDSNRTPEGRAKNRRVELLVERNYTNPGITLLENEIKL